jgi:hypothetical protein
LVRQGSHAAEVDKFVHFGNRFFFEIAQESSAFNRLDFVRSFNRWRVRTPNCASCWRNWFCRN